MAISKTKLGVSKSSTASGISDRAANIAYTKSGANSCAQCDEA